MVIANKRGNEIPWVITNPSIATVAAEIGGPAGELPLLGTDLRADDYEALRWNAARCGAADLPDVALLIAGLAAADEFDLAAAAASVPLCRAVLVGRPPLWGLSVSGADGVSAVLEHLRDEMVRAMQLCGAANLAALTPALVKQ